MNTLHAKLLQRIFLKQWLLWSFKVIYRNETLSVSNTKRGGPEAEKSQGWSSTHPPAGMIDHLKHNLLLTTKLPCFYLSSLLRGSALPSDKSWRPGIQTPQGKDTGWIWTSTFWLWGKSANYYTTMKLKKVPEHLFFYDKQHHRYLLGLCTSIGLVWSLLCFSWFIFYF